MSMKAVRDIYKVANSLAPAARTATANGTGMDLANVEENEITFVVGTITDGIHTPKIQDSPDNSVWTDVVAADQVGTFANLASNVNQSVSYIGKQRYVRAVTTIAGATTGGVYAAVTITRSRKQP